MLLLLVQTPLFSILQLSFFFLFCHRQVLYSTSLSEKGIGSYYLEISSNNSYKGTKPKTHLKQKCVCTVEGAATVLYLNIILFFLLFSTFHIRKAFL